MANRWWFGDGGHMSAANRTLPVESLGNVLVYPAVSLPQPKSLLTIAAGPLDPGEVLDAIGRMSHAQRERLAALLGVPRPRHEFLYLPRPDGGYLEPEYSPGDP